MTTYGQSAIFTDRQTIIGATLGAFNINSLTSSPLVGDGKTPNVAMFLSVASTMQGMAPEFPVPVNFVTIGATTVLCINSYVPSGGSYPEFTLAIASITWLANVATVTTASPHGLTGTVLLNINGAVPVGYNGAFSCTVTGVSTFTYPLLTNPGTETTPGTFAIPPRHWLKPNQAFQFTLDSGGTLPSGAALNTTYYLRSAGMTANTFTFSKTNNYAIGQTEGSAVATSGSANGVNIVLTGREVNIFIPPGSYFIGNYAAVGVPNISLTPNGITRARYFAYGAIFDTHMGFGTAGGLRNAADWSFSTADFGNTTANQLNASGANATFILNTVANAAKYYIGQTVSLFGLDIQNTYGALTSGPPNNHYQEYKRIIAIDLATGMLTFDGPLKWVYLSTFPNLFNGSPGTNTVGGGPAMVVAMHPSWDCEVTVKGGKWIGQPPSPLARTMLIEDAVFEGYGNDPGGIFPGICQRWIFRNCRFGPSEPLFVQIDKMLEYLEYDGNFLPNGSVLSFPSTSLQLCVIKRHVGFSVEGTPRNIKICDSSIPSINIGPQVSGFTDSCEITSTQANVFDMNQRSDDWEFIRPGNDMTLVPNWAFNSTTGVFTRNISALPGLQSMGWQVPGGKIYFADASGTYKYYQNMGSPFVITNVTMDGSGNFSFGTSLRAIPTRQTSATVTMDLSTDVVSGMTLANGTPVCLTTTGALPTGVTNSTIYWVVNTSGATSKLALTAGGAAINLSGSQSGVHTMYANPLYFRPHPCTRYTGHGNWGCATVEHMNGAVDVPLFSQIRQGFIGIQSALGGNPSAFQSPNPRIWGTLNDTDKVLRVNVLRAGVGAGQTLTISCPGFVQPGLALSTFSQTIDTTTAGLRTIGQTINTSPAGVAGTEAITPYADWVAGPLVYTWASMPANAVDNPVVSLEMFTSQGIHNFANLMGAPSVPATGTNLWQWNNSGIQEQYGTSP